MHWAEARERLEAPIFAPLRRALATLPAERWPTREELTRAAAGVTTAQGTPIRFVAPRVDRGKSRSAYETRIARTGEIETRAENWHDAFNALAWIAYPRAKAAINAQHAAILDERGDAEARSRSPERDALTLFDEGGVIVASRTTELLGLIVDFEWKALFWQRRSELEASMRFFAFGHALCEQALEPYLGIVAKAVLLPVDAAVIALASEAQLARIDALAATYFGSRSRFASPKAMPPLPVLGIPGWHPGTGSEAFYDDTRHFRPAHSGRRKS